MPIRPRTQSMRRRRVGPALIVRAAHRYPQLYPIMAGINVPAESPSSCTVHPQSTPVRPRSSLPRPLLLPSAPKENAADRQRKMTLPPPRQSGQSTRHTQDRTSPTQNRSRISPNSGCFPHFKGGPPPEGRSRAPFRAAGAAGIPASRCAGEQAHPTITARSQPDDSQPGACRQQPHRKAPRNGG
jgi:hypothetical protein